MELAVFLGIWLVYKGNDQTAGNKVIPIRATRPARYIKAPQLATNPIPLHSPTRNLKKKPHQLTRETPTNTSPRAHSYDATYTNTTHPHLRSSYDILPKNLTFPGLHLLHAQEGKEWRFTDHVCLPPRISLGDPDRQTKEDVHGELSDDCTKYR